MFKKNIWPIIIIVLLVINLAGLGTMVYHKCQFSKCGIFRCHQHPSCSTDFFQKELNLTPDQLVKFRDIKKAYHKNADMYIDSLDSLKKMLFQEILQDKPNEQKLSNISLETGKVTTELKNITIKHFLDIKSILNKDQQNKFFNLLGNKSCCRNPMHNRCGKHDRDSIK